MPKRKSKSVKVIKFISKLIYKLFYYIFLGVFYIFKGIYLGIAYIIKKIKNKKTKAQDNKEIKNNEESENKEVKEEKIEVKKGKIKNDPEPIDFKILKTKQGDFNKFLEKVFTSNSTIGIILGARGTGKSAIGMCLLEQFKLKTNKKIYALGFNANDLPTWINVIESIDDVDNGSALLADESGIEFSSRESMSDKNKFLTNLLLVARHKDLSVLFISQNSANIEINAIRQADFLILKPSSLLQKDFERKKIKDIYEEVQEQFDELKEEKGLAYIYSHDYRGFISNSLPSFWSQKVSKAYQGFKKE